MPEDPEELMIYDSEWEDIIEVSAVDQGANPGAHIVLCKAHPDSRSNGRLRNGPRCDRLREDGGRANVQTDDRLSMFTRLGEYLGLRVTSKSAPAAEVEVSKEGPRVDTENKQAPPPTDKMEDGADELTARLAELEAENASLRAQLEESMKMEDEEDEEKRAAEAEKRFRGQLPEGMRSAFDGLQPAERQKMLASQTPEGPAPSENPLLREVSKRLADQEAKLKEQQKRLAEMENERQTNELRDRFKGLAPAVRDLGEFVERYKVLHKVNPESAEAMVEETRANAERARSALFVVRGKGVAPEAGSATGRLAEKASKLRETEKGLSDAQAKRRILQANPKLKAEYLREQRGERSA